MSIETPAAKSIILYHRSYRIIPGSLGLYLLQIMLFVVPLSIGSILFYPEITEAICQVAKYVLAPHYPANAIHIVETQFLSFVNDYSYLRLPGAFPTPFFSQINALICVVLLFVLRRIETAKPVMIFFMMILFIHLASSLFFVIFPRLFPYDTTEYSRLYMLQQISIGFFMPLLMGLAVMSLPASLLSRCTVVYITYFYSLIFGTLRYITFLYLLNTISVLYMAVFYFVLGPLIDFVYVAGFYSVFIARTAKKMKGDTSVWKW